MRSRSITAPHVRRVAEVMEIGREPVGDVDAARGHAAAASCRARLRASGSRWRRFADSMNSRSGVARRSSVPRCIQRQSGRGTADRPAEVDAIAARARRYAESAALASPIERDGDEELFGSRKIAADDLDAALFAAAIASSSMIVRGRPLVGRADRDDRVSRPCRPSRRCRRD